MISTIIDIIEARKYQYLMRMKSAKKNNKPQRQHDQKMKAEAMTELITLINSKGGW